MMGILYLHYTYIHQDCMTDAINVPDDHGIHKCLCYNCTTNNNDNPSCKGLPCLQPYHNTILENNVFVWTSSVHGFGVFALKHLKPKDIICLFTGKVKSSQQTDNDYTCKVDGGNNGGDDLFIDSSNQDNYSGRYINHSCVPNARLVVPVNGVLRCKKTNKRGVIVECVREIQQHEEIFIDYGKEYFLQNTHLDVSYFYKHGSNISDTVCRRGTQPLHQSSATNPASAASIHTTTTSTPTQTTFTGVKLSIQHNNGTTPF